MPWKIEKRNGAKPFKIVNEETGAVKGSTKTQPQAVKALRALYANVPEARTPRKGKK
jgi:hypothetical protein